MDIKILELDLTGSNVDNRITDEIHRLTKIENKNDRIICPRYGTFYVESLIVREVSGRPLEEGRDYKLAYHESDYSELTGKDLESLIIIVNPDVSNDVKIEYQALGGKLEIVKDFLQVKLDELDEWVLEYKFEDIVGLPEGWVGDADHPHKYWQLYGWDSLIENLDGLGDALGRDRTALHSAVDEYVGIYKGLLDDIMELYRAYMNHVNGFGNPHGTTDVHLDLDLIMNWHMADYEESKNITNDSLYMGVHGVTSLYVEYLYPYLRAHIDNKQNPHQVTAAMLGLFTRDEIDAFYNERLLKSSRAYDSNLFEGRDIETFTSNVRTNLKSSDIKKNELFNINRMATNVSTAFNGLNVLTGDNRLLSVEDISYEADRGDLFTTWRFLPGSSSDAGSWNAIVAASATPGTILLKNVNLGTYSYFMAGLRQANGTTVRIA